MPSTTKDIITSERLVLRSADASDLDDLFRVVFSDAQVMSQAFSGNRAMSKEDAAQFFKGHFDFEGTGKALGVLCLKETREVIGFSGLLACDVFGKAEDDYEIGFVLGRDYWGKGYATEIGKAQVEYGLGEEAGCSRLLGVVRADNLASKKALAKSGLTYHSTRQTSDRGEREIYVVEKTKE